VFNVLEDGLQVYLADPQEVKNRKGHKTDKQDSWWLAHRLRHATILPSFVPPCGLRELRDWLRRTLIESAWAAAGKKNCVLKQKFWRLATNKQRKPPAAMAIAHTLLVLCYQVLNSGRPYKERGLPVMGQNQREHLIRHHVRRLGRLGIRIRSLALVEPLNV